MTKTISEIVVQVDPANPGQFFACCGLLELADRLWPGAEGWFDNQEFRIRTGGSLGELIDQFLSAHLGQIDMSNDTSSPISIGAPFRPFTLDWWLDDRAGGKELKVWAGTMESVRIARAMHHALRDSQFRGEDCLNIGVVAYDPDDLTKKVEPFYFDARRGPNAHSRDVGFSPNDLKITTTAYPAVEIFCLIGLQRCLPSRTDRPRVYDYFTWAAPIPPLLLPAVVTGVMASPCRQQFRFENWYRTGQRKHKAFRSATVIYS